MRVVQRSSELVRISALPRRSWQPVSDQLIDALTAHLRAPGGAMRLRPWQAAGLCELHDNGGLFAQASVGQGKTLTSALAPVVLGAKRPLLLIPAKLRDKTIRDFRALKRDWQMVPIRIESYELLGRADKAGQARLDLEKFQPDLIILDEAHRLKNKKSARTRRMNRYIRECRKNGTPLVVLAMSGTLAKRSLRDFAHILEWCHPGRSPLPHDEFDLILWADAIDEKPAAVDAVDPGALLGLCGPEEKDLDDRTAARRAVGRRIFETPGCMATVQADGIDASLLIECHEIIVAPAVEAAFKHMKTTWTTPCGLPIADGLGMMRHSRELACGFYYRWITQPAQEWMHARSDWCSAVRELLSTNRRGLDSEFQVALEVADAIRHGRPHPLADVYQEWQRLKPMFKPETVPVWLSDDALRWAITWADKEPGLVWTEHVAVGEKLSELSGLPYYGRLGLDKKNRYIEDHKPGSSAIASIASNSEGRNLQSIWSRALFVSFPPTGYIAEQAIGRLHRPGQLADEVVCDVMISCREQLAGFEQALRDANFHTDALQSVFKLDLRVLGSKGLDNDNAQGQTSRSADIVVPTFAANGWAWKAPARTSRESRELAS